MVIDSIWFDVDDVEDDDVFKFETWIGCLLVIELVDDDDEEVDGEHGEKDIGI